MGTLFFCFVLVLLAGYAVLDGYDLGTGILHLRLARDDAERRQLLATIGPLWDGNEVFLIAAGGTLFFAFPDLYAASFSGFYLPLMIVLWLFMIRGVSIELRSHLAAAPWRQFFDVAFFLSSALLAFFLGVAIGNVVRGVPIGPDHVFIQPLWTTFLVGPGPGVIDWYTAVVGLTAVLVLAEQGALWCALRTTAATHDRARALVPRLWTLAVASTVGMTVATFVVQPRVLHAMLGEPWRLIFPAGGIAALVATPLLHRAGRPGLAFVGWSAVIALLLGSAAFGIYPWVLPSSIDSRYSLAVEQVQAADASLRIGAVWWSVGVALALGYTAYVHWRFSGRVAPH